MPDRETLRAVLAERLQLPLQQVSDDADLVADLGADSLALAELSSFLEQRSGTRIPAEDLILLETVGDLLDLCGKLPQRD